MTPQAAAKVNPKLPPPPTQPTLSYLMRSSKSLSSGLSKMAVSEHSGRLRINGGATSHLDLSNEDDSMQGNLQGQDRHNLQITTADLSSSEVAEGGARPKTPCPSTKRAPNKKKQAKTMSTSMEIWEIQKSLKRGEMVQVRGRSINT